MKIEANCDTPLKLIYEEGLNSEKRGRGMSVDDFIWIVVLGLFFGIVFAFNVGAHEFGHSLAAEYYGLHPQMRFHFSALGNASFGFEGIPLATTVFDVPEEKEEHLVIVLLGPFLNFILGCYFFVLGAWGRGRIRELCLIGGVVSLGAFVMNILPFGGSDGAWAWKWVADF